MATYIDNAKPPTTARPSRVAYNKRTKKRAKITDKNADKIRADKKTSHAHGLKTGKNRKQKKRYNYAKNQL